MRLLVCLLSCLMVVGFSTDRAVANVSAESAGASAVLVVDAAAVADAEMAGERDKAATDCVDHCHSLAALAPGVVTLSFRESAQGRPVFGRSAEPMSLTRPPR